jgi:hypothetical protein
MEQKLVRRSDAVTILPHEWRLMMNTHSQFACRAAMIAVAALLVMTGTDAHARGGPRGSTPIVSTQGPPPTCKGAACVARPTKGPSTLAHRCPGHGGYGRGWCYN